MTPRIAELARAIVDLGLATPGQLHGCTTEEIAGVERAFDLRFPEAYRDWLLAMGRGAGKFLRGSDAFYYDLPNLRTAAEELLAEEGNQFSLPPDAFVFLVHQGYQFLCFATAGGEPDPAVLYYFPGGQKDGWARLTDYYFQVLHDQVLLKG